METTLSKIMKIQNEQGKEAAIKYLEEINDKINMFSHAELINKMKSYIKICPVPDYVKDYVLSTKAYELEIDENGNIRTLKISRKCVNEDRSDHYYIDLSLTQTFFCIKGGAHYNETSLLIDINVIEDFLFSENK